MFILLQNKLLSKHYMINQTMTLVKKNKKNRELICLWSTKPQVNGILLHCFTMDTVRAPGIEVNHTEKLKKKIIKNGS